VIGVCILKDKLGLRLLFGAGLIKPVDNGVGEGIASEGVSSGAKPVPRPLLSGNVFEVFRAKALILRGFRTADTVGEKRRSCPVSVVSRSGPPCAVSGDVPGVSAEDDKPLTELPVIGEDSVESVVLVEMLPRWPPNRDNGSSLATDLRELGALSAACCCCDDALLSTLCCPCSYARKSMCLPE
jgi:hypothetical protein